VGWGMKAAVSRLHSVVANRVTRQRCFRHMSDRASLLVATRLAQQRSVQHAMAVGAAVDRQTPPGSWPADRKGTSERKLACGEPSTCPKFAPGLHT